MSDPLEGVEWLEVQVQVHLYDWKIGEVHLVNVQDKETRALIDAGLLVILDEETRALLPPPPAAASSGGCGCGH